MTPEQAKKLPPIVHALSEGKRVRTRYGSGCPWVTGDKINALNPDWEYEILHDPIERWIVIDRDGDEYNMRSRADAENFSNTHSFGPCRIVHMVEADESN